MMGFSFLTGIPVSDKSFFTEEEWSEWANPAPQMEGLEVHIGMTDPNTGYNTPRGPIFSTPGLAYKNNLFKNLSFVSDIKSQRIGVKKNDAAPLVTAAPNRNPREMQTLRRELGEIGKKAAGELTLDQVLRTTPRLSTMRPFISIAESRTLTSKLDILS